MAGNRVRQDCGRRVGAKARIVEAARQQILQGGESAVASGPVATAAGVSKALVHYHFHNKRGLLCGIAQNCADRIQKCEDVDGDATGNTNPVDDFWR